MTKGINLFDEKKITLYKCCIEDKQLKEKFHIQGAYKATQLLELVHSDMCGLIQVGRHLGCTSSHSLII